MLRTDGLGSKGSPRFWYFQKEAILTNYFLPTVQIAKLCGSTWYQSTSQRRYLAPRKAAIRSFPQLASWETTIGKEACFLVPAYYKIKFVKEKYLNLTNKQKIVLSWWLHVLLLHMCRYHLNRKFTCDECGRSFSTESYMYKHRLTHSGTEVFTFWCLMDRWMLVVESRCVYLILLLFSCLFDSIYFAVELSLCIGCLIGWNRGLGYRKWFAVL